MTSAPVISFASLGLAAPLIRAVTASGYAAPTPVQERTIPAVLAGADVMASADTGSGKTAAFVLPILHAFAARPVEKPRSLRALILAPTRELGAQIAESIATYGRFLPTPPKTVVVCGGSSQNLQRMALRGGADVMVATPGRLLALIDEGSLVLSSVSTFVLDEADRMLALGFADELGRIVALLPPRRQSVLVSATFPEGVQALATALLHAPERIEVNAAQAPAAAIAQRVIQVDPERRTQLLLHLVAEGGFSRVLVFVATRYGADHLVRKLLRAGVTARPLHGDLSQGARNGALADFKAGTARVVVATDLAARGLDVPELPCVISFDLPRSPTDHVHRVGRTGRAGEAGTAIAFVGPADEAHFRLIEKRHGLRLPREQVPGFEPAFLEVAAPAEASAGGIKGKRKSKKDKLREAAAEREPHRSPPGAPSPKK